MFLPTSFMFSSRTSVVMPRLCTGVVLLYLTICTKHLQNIYIHIHEQIYFHNSPCEQSKNLNWRISIKLHVTTLNFGHYIYKTLYKKIVWSNPPPSFKTTKHHDRYHQPPHVSWSLTPYPSMHHIQHFWIPSTHSTYPDSRFKWQSMHHIQHNRIPGPNKNETNYPYHVNWC